MTKREDAVPVHPRYLEELGTDREKFERVIPNRAPPRFRRWKYAQPAERQKYNTGKQELIDIVKDYYKTK